MQDNNHSIYQTLNLNKVPVAKFSQAKVIAATLVFILLKSQVIFAQKYQETVKLTQDKNIARSLFDGLLSISFPTQSN